MQQENAERIALEALSWMASDDEVFGTFLGATGASIDDVRAEAANPAFLSGVLSFIMMNDDWVIACCDAQSIPYERLGEAAQSLPGGALPNWT